MDSSPHPLCPSCTTLSSGPSLFRIHLMPCCCGSMMSGQRSLVVRMAAFSVDILSFGRPWLCQAATVASSVSMRIGSRPSVRGTETWNRNRGMMSLLLEHFWRHGELQSTDLTVYSLSGCSVNNTNDGDLTV